jgi:hypothetical protein
MQMVQTHNYERWQRMSRKHGGRPGYGWSNGHQGGFRPAGRGKTIYKQQPSKPSQERFSKTLVTEAARNNWSVRGTCAKCGHSKTTPLFMIVALEKITPKMTISDLIEREDFITCESCEQKGNVTFLLN